MKKATAKLLRQLADNLPPIKKVDGSGELVNHYKQLKNQWVKGGQKNIEAYAIMMNEINKIQNNEK